MAQDNPKSLNDDHIRSWTISSAPSRSKGGTVGCGAWDETSEFTLTIKRKPGGSISNLLHDLVVNDKQPLVVPLISTAGTFVLPVPKTLPSAAPYAQQKVALISGGIGSTPFISMIRGARQSTAPALDLRWVMSARYFEDLLPQILQELTSPAHTQDTGDSLNEESSLSLTVDAFLTRASAISVTAPVQHYGLHDVRVHFERLGINGLQSAIPDIQDRTILLCGPEPFMEAVKGYLQELSIPAGQILTEDFNF
ncbi:hypothetical protein BGX28_006593 [Mortierella sp. GBA30]|nr:hypothetical protein BGX28_006593 [Mortierella sp. GBA30]